MLKLLKMLKLLTLYILIILSTTTTAIPTTTSNDNNNKLNTTYTVTGYGSINVAADLTRVDGSIHQNIMLSKPVNSSVLASNELNNIRNILIEQISIAVQNITNYLNRTDIKPYIHNYKTVVYRILHTTAYINGTDYTTGYDSIYEIIVDIDTNKSSTILDGLLLII